MGNTAQMRNSVSMLDHNVAKRKSSPEGYLSKGEVELDIVSFKCFARTI